MTEKKRLRVRNRAVLDALAGATAGCIARFVVGPLDVLKIRFQASMTSFSKARMATSRSTDTVVMPAVLVHAGPAHLHCQDDSECPHCAYCSSWGDTVVLVRLHST